MPLPEVVLRAEYFDTEDLRLARWQVTFRHRTGEPARAGWDLKIPLSGATREERHIDAPPGAPPATLTALVLGITRGAPLRAVAVLRTVRRPWSLRDDSGRELAIVADDVVRVEEGQPGSTPFREIEVEQREGSSETLERIADELVRAGARESEGIPKLVRALGAPAAEPPIRTVDVRSGGSVGDAARAAMAAAAARLIRHDPIARLGDDPEGIHQMRVGARRFRSALRTFAPLLDAAWAQELTEELRWLGSVLGPVRDLDVQRELLGLLAADLLDDLRPLAEVLTRERARARSAAMSGLRTPRYVTLLDRLVGADGEPPFGPEAARPAADALPSLVAPLWKALASRGRAVGPDTTDEELHAIRIRAKRVRYAAEDAAPGLGSKRSAAERLATHAEYLQDELGRLQDAAVARRLVQEAANRRSSDGPFCLAAGRLLERIEAEAGEARGSFPRGWNRLDRKKVTRWLRSDR